MGPLGAAGKYAGNLSITPRCECDGDGGRRVSTSRYKDDIVDNAPLFNMGDTSPMGKRDNLGL